LKTKLIVATSENNVIGLQNKLPWNLPDDMKFFKDKTMGSCVIMGKNNYLSIPNRFRPLKGRINIILTKQTSFKAPNCIIETTLESAIKLAKKEQKKIFIIGGGMVYKYALEQNLVDIIYLTRIHAKIKGDIFFPELDMNQWSKIEEHFHPKDENHKYNFTFLKFVKN